MLSEGRRENASRGRDYEEISPFFTPPPAALDILISPGLAEDPEGLRPPSALRSAEAFSLYYKEESHIGRPGKALATTEGRGPCSCCAHTD